MATNDFKAFATGVSANVLSQSAYVALSSLISNGFQSGTADSEQLNKVWRQSSVMAQLLGDFIVSRTGQDALDDGNLTTLLTNFVLAVSSVSTSVSGSILNLKGNSAGAVKTASWTVDEITVETNLGGSVYKGSGLTLSFNGATTGANGMDTGATPTSSSLYIYAIYNPSSNTWATLGTVSGSGASIYGGSNMPSGYTASTLLWSGVTNGSGQIAQFSQVAKNIKVVQVPIISGGSATSYTNLSLATAVPANAKMADGYFTNPSGIVNIASNTSGVGQIETQAGSVGAMAPFYDMHMITSQNLSYKVSGGTGLQLWISGYSI